ncbi:MAG: HD-GYP domain-containing protein [Actinobacteria bacterium]|nr:MAG: HD-GYP domain-containing protein [Actinomycetota bacterium]
MNAVVAKLRELESPSASIRLAGLVDRLELKEGYTGEHTAAVSGLALALATELKLGPDERRCVELGALLHDVGKLSIPDRVLTKPGPLNELEWAAMRRHAALGERLLAHILDQADVLAIVRSHHERWDGSGYPDGKSGEDIPLSARIVAVADAFQAMIEPRPYRAPRTRVSALEEIASQSGRQFDPACVEALRAVV